MLFELIITIKVTSFKLTIGINTLHDIRLIIEMSSISSNYCPFITATHCFACSNYLNVTNADTSGCKSNISSNYNHLYVQC